MIRLSKCSLSGDELSNIKRVLDSEFLGMGPVVRDFERAIASFLGVTEQSVVSCSNGTNAIELALRCLNIGLGDEVIVPSNTYVATICAVIGVGATPVIADIDSSTLCISQRSLKANISRQTKAIIYVAYAGVTDSIQEIEKLSREYEIPLIEDAAHAFGSTYPDKIRMVGDSPNLVCFSFDGIKNITCGEGGAVIARDPNLSSLIRDDRLLGVVRDSEYRALRTRALEYEISRPGRRYHLSDINAAIGLAQLENFGASRGLRWTLRDKYNRSLSRFDAIDHYLVTSDSSSVPHIYPIIFKNENLCKQVKATFSQRSIPFGVHYPPLGGFEAFKGFEKKECVEHRSVSKKLITIPFHPDLTDAERQIIVSAISDTLDNG